MSDISGSDESIRINAVVTDNATSATAIIANELNNLANSIASLASRQVSLGNSTSALNKALGLTTTGAVNASKVTFSLSKNNNLLAASIEQARKSLALLNKEYSNLNRAASGSAKFNQAFAQTTGHLNSAISAQSSFSRLIRGNELINYGKKVSGLGTAAQQSGYLFTRNFSAPIIMGLREAFFQFSKLETQNVRITKLLNDNFMSTVDANGKFVSSQVQARAAVDMLGKSLDKITAKWGVSRVLVQSIAGDFAELGIGISNSTIESEQMLYNLTAMTAEMEKLGNLDITASQEFVSAMYQNILAVRRELGRSVQVNDAQVAAEIGAELRGQMAMFNIVENKTVMSLRNIAEAFPEVSAAATMFGLNMTEAIAMVVPMIATGFQVGASANSVKVSLQRMVAQTKQNTQIIAGLNEELGPNFKYAAGIGIENLNDLTNSFLALEKAKGKQGTLELASRMFGVRQGPRMATTLNQMGQFQESLKGPGQDQSKGYASGIVTEEYKIAQALERNVNLRLKSAGLEQITVRSIEDIGKLHRGANEQISATNSSLTRRAALIKQGQIDAQSELQKIALANGKSIDFISETATEFSKVYLSMGFDVENYAAKITEQELELSRNTPKVRYDSLKASIVAMGVAIVPIIDDLVKFVLPFFQKFAKAIQDMPTYVKKVVGAFMLLMAVTGPLTLAFGTVRVLFGGVVQALGRLTLGFGKARVSAVSLMDIINNPNLLRGAKAVTQLPGSQGFLVQGSSRASRLPFGLGGKRPLDVSGLDSSSLDVLRQSNILPNQSRSTLASPMGMAKKFLRDRREQAPSTSELLSTLMSNESTKAKTAAEAAKKITDSVEKSSAKGVKTLADGTKGALSKVAKTIGSIFQNNTFVGNTFTGGTGGKFGPGGKGIGPSSPSTGGTSPRGPPKQTADKNRPAIPVNPSKELTPGSQVLPQLGPRGLPVNKLPSSMNLDELIERRTELLKSLTNPNVDAGFQNWNKASLKTVNDLIAAKNKLASIPAPTAPVVLPSGKTLPKTPALPVFKPQEIINKSVSKPVFNIPMGGSGVLGKVSSASQLMALAGVLESSKKDLVEITGKEIAGFYTSFGRAIPEELKDISNLAGGKTFKIPAPTKASIIKNISEGGNLVSKMTVGKGKKAVEEIVALSQKANAIGKLGVPTGIFDGSKQSAGDVRELFANITSQMYPTQTVDDIMEVFNEGQSGKMLPKTNLGLGSNKTIPGKLTLTEFERIVNSRLAQDAEVGLVEKNLNQLLKERQTISDRVKKGKDLSTSQALLMAPDAVTGTAIDTQIRGLESELKQTTEVRRTRIESAIRNAESSGARSITAREGYDLATERAKNEVKPLGGEIAKTKKLPGAATNPDIAKKIQQLEAEKAKRFSEALDRNLLRVAQEHRLTAEELAESAKVVSDREIKKTGRGTSSAPIKRYKAKFDKDGKLIGQTPLTAKQAAAAELREKKVLTLRRLSTTPNPSAELMGDYMRDFGGTEEDLKKEIENFKKADTARKTAQRRMDEVDAQREADKGAPKKRKPKQTSTMLSKASKARQEAKEEAELLAQETKKASKRAVKKADDVAVKLRTDVQKAADIEKIIKQKEEYQRGVTARDALRASKSNRGVRVRRGTIPMGTGEPTPLIASPKRGIVEQRDLIKAEIRKTKYNIKRLAKEAIETAKSAETFNALNGITETIDHSQTQVNKDLRRAQTKLTNLNKRLKAVSPAASQSTARTVPRPRRPNIAFMVPAGDSVPVSGGIPGFDKGPGGILNPVSSMVDSTKRQVVTYKELMLRAINDFEVSAKGNPKEIKAIAAMMRSTLNDVPGAMSGLINSLVPAEQIDEVMKSLKLELDGVNKKTKQSLSKMQKGAAHRFKNIKKMFADDSGAVYGSLDAKTSKGVSSFGEAARAGNMAKQSATAKSIAPYALADVYAKSVRNLGYNAMDASGKAASGVAEMNVGATEASATKYKVQQLLKTKNMKTGAKYSLEELLAESKISQSAADLFKGDISTIQKPIEELNKAAESTKEVITGAAEKIDTVGENLDEAAEAISKAAEVPVIDKPEVSPKTPGVSSTPTVPGPIVGAPLVTGDIPVNTEIGEIDNRILKLKEKIAKNEEKLLNILPTSKAQAIVLEEARILSLTEQKAAALAEGKDSKARLIGRQITESNKRLKSLNNEKEALERATKDLITKDNKTLKDLNTARAKALKAAQATAATSTAGSAGKSVGKQAAQVGTAGAAAGVVAAASDGGLVGTLVNTLDEFELEIDSALANIFKGPNLFIGPNKFISNDFINAKSVKIKDLAKGGGGSGSPVGGGSGFRKVKMGPGGVVSEATSSVDDVARSVKSPLATIKERDRILKPSLGQRKLPIIDGHTPRAPLPINKDLLARLDVRKAQKAAAASAVADPITPAVKSISKKIMDGGSKIGSSLLKVSKSVSQAAFEISKTALSNLSSGAGKIGKGAARTIIDNQKLIKPANVYKGFDMISQARSKASSGILGSVSPSLMKALTGSISEMGRVSAQTAKIMSGQLLLSIKEINSSMQSSKIIKLWTTMLFAGTNKIIPSLRAATSAIFKMDLSQRKAAVSAALLHKANTKGSALSFGSKMLTGLNAFTGASGLAIGAIGGIRKAVVGLVVTFLKFNALAMLVAPIVLLIVGMFSSIKSSGAKTAVAMDKIKQAFALVKEAIITLANPIMDMVQAFGGFTRLGLQEQGQKTSGALTTLAEMIRRVASAFNSFAKSSGVQYVAKVMVPVLTRIINRFILLGRAIGDAFRGNGVSAMKNMKALMLSIVYEAFAVVKKLMSFIANLLISNSKMVGDFIATVVDNSIKMFIAIAAKLRELALFVGSVLVGMGVAAGVVFAPAGVALATMGSSLLAFGAGTFVAEKAFDRFGKSIKTGVANVSGKIVKGIGGAFGAAAILSQKAQDKLNKSYEKITGKGINLPIARLFADPNQVAKEIKDSVVKAAPDAQAGGEGIGSAIAKGIKNKLLEMKTNWTEKFFGNLDQEFDKISGKIKKQLDKQKENALDGYDDMISGIEALAEAEEKLTKKIDYEEKRREMIRDRSVDAENYIRERKLAIYEGRYEDARRMDGEERKAKLSAAKELKDLDQSFNRDLQAEQREIAKNIIENEKKIVEEKFDLLMENFDDQVDILKKTGFATQEEFKKALNSIGDLGLDFHNNMTKTFSDSMKSLPTAISSMRDGAIPMFDTEMSTLVDIAAKKFGASANVKDPSSILGAAYFMANGMSDAFKTAFDSSLITQYMQPTMTALTDLAKKTLSDTDPEGFVSLWKKAGKLAALEMINELKRSIAALKGEIFDEFAKIFEDLFKELESLSIIEATLRVKRERETGGGGDGEKTPGASSPKLDEKSIRPRVPEGFTTADTYLAKLGLNNMPINFEIPDVKPMNVVLELIKDIWNGMSNVGKAITGFIGAIGGVLLAVGIFKQLLIIVEAVKFAFFAIQYYLYAAFGAAAGTIAAVVLAIGAVIGALVWAYFRFEKFRDLVNASASVIWDSIVYVWDAAWAAVSGFVSGTLDYLKNLWSSIKGFASEAWNSIKGITMDTIGKIISFFVDGFNALKDNIAGFAESFSDFTKKVVGAVVDAVKTIAAPIMEFLNKIVTGIGIVIGVVIGAIVGFVGGLIVIIVNIFDKIKGPLFSITGFIIDVFAKLFDILGPIMEFGIKIIAAILASPFKILNKIIDIAVGAIKISLGIVVGAFGIVASAVGSFIGAIVTVFTAITTNPVFVWIRDFLFRVLMLGIFLVAISLQNTFKLLVSLFTGIIKVMKPVGEFIVGVLVGAFEVLKTVISKIGDGVSYAFNFIFDIVKNVFDKIYSIVSNFVSWWNDNVGSLWLLLITPFVVLYESLKRLFSFIGDNLGPVLSAVWDGFKTALSFVFDLVKGFAEYIAGGFVGIWNALKTILSVVWDGLKIGLSFVFDLITKLAGYIATGFISIWNSLKTVLSAVWDGFKIALSFVWTLIKGLAGYIAGGFIGIWNVLKIVLSAVWDGLKIGLSFVFELLKKVGSFVADVFMKIWENIGPIISSVFDGLKSALSFVFELIVGLADYIATGFVEIWNILKETIKTVFDVIMWGWSIVGPILGKMWTVVKESIVFYFELLKAVIGKVWDAIKIGWSFVGPILDKLWTVIKDGAVFYFEALKNIIGKVWDAITLGWSFVGPILDKLWTAVKDGAVFYFDLLVAVIGKVWDAVQFIWEKIQPVLQIFGDFIKSTIGKALDGVIAGWGMLKDAFSTVYDFVVPKVRGLGEIIKDVFGGAIDFVKTAFGKIPEAFKGSLNFVIRAINKVTGFKFTMPDWIKYLGMGSIAGKTYSFRDVIPAIDELYSGGMVKGYMGGGMVKGYMSGGEMSGYAAGGFTKGPPQQGIPAILHGGEYVINHKAVQRIGTDTLQQINSMKLSKPNFPKMPSVPSVNMPNMKIMNNTYSQQPAQSSSTENINIFVDNFIGEADWFNSMMSEYNVKILPRKQKAAGLEKRVISTYNGLNRGN
jgi:phage-related protein